MSIRPAVTVVVARPGSTPASPLEILTLRRSTLVPVRFDATFFAVAAVRGLTATPNGVEIERFGGRPRRPSWGRCPPATSC